MNTKRLIVRAALALFLGAGLYALFTHYFSLRSPITSCLIVGPCSLSCKTIIKQRVLTDRNQSASDLLSSLKKRIATVESLSITRQLPGKSHATIALEKPIALINTTHLLTGKKTIGQQSWYLEALLKNLPSITTDAYLIAEHHAEDIYDFFIKQPPSFFSHYHVTYHGPTFITAADSQERLVLILTKNNSFNERSEDAIGKLRALIQERSKFKKFRKGLWRADMRFNDMIVLSFQAGGKS